MRDSRRFLRIPMAATVLVAGRRRSAPGHRDATARQGRPAFTQRVHVNVTDAPSVGRGAAGSMETGPAQPRSNALDVADVERLPWPCREFGHEPMSSNPARCYDGCDLSAAQG